MSSELEKTGVDVQDVDFLIQNPLPSAANPLTCSATRQPQESAAGTGRLDGKAG